MLAEAGRHSGGCSVAEGRLSSRGGGTSPMQLSGKAGPRQTPRAKTWAFLLEEKELQPGAGVASLRSRPSGHEEGAQTQMNCCVSSSSTQQPFCTSPAGTAVAVAVAGAVTVTGSFWLSAACCPGSASFLPRGTGTGRRRCVATAGELGAFVHMG